MKSAIESGLSFMQTGDASLEVRLAGAWRLRGGLPSAALLQHELESAPQVKKVAFEAGELSSWDSSVLAFLVEVSKLEVLRFETNNAQEAQVAARWTVRHAVKKDLVRYRDTRFSRPASERSTAASVAALSDVLAELSRQIAQAIEEMDGKSK